MRIMRKDILPFLGFFLMTIGNGKYLGAKCGDLIEYLGIAVLLILCYWPTKTHHISVTKIIKVLFLTSLLSIGAFIKGTPTKACYMIALTSFALMSFSLMSQSILSTNKRIKIAASAIFSGAVFSALIGLITGTLGFTLGSDESIVGILYVSGFQVKNYCGGIWLLLFILNYIYYIRNGRLGYKEKIVLTMFLFLIVLSGSKGALALSLIWILLINFDRILKFRKNQKKIFGFVVGIVACLIGVYIYNNILINVYTYAYRMRGLSNLVEYMLQDSRNLFFGLSDIAYANSGVDYTTNMRRFLGWQSSVEMAYVNILIKNGLIGFISYILIFKNFLSGCKRCTATDQSIVKSLVIVLLISGLTETYAASIHYVVGPVMYCLIRGLIYQDRRRLHTR
jgi:hypothetical protein